MGIGDQKFSTPIQKVDREEFIFFRGGVNSFAPLRAPDCGLLKSAALLPQSVKPTRKHLRQNLFPLIPLTPHPNFITRPLKRSNLRAQVLRLVHRPIPQQQPEQTSN